jgi:flagellar biosynthesis/type III secretory pathway M-ring protein FliF/YscJ
MSEAPDLNMPGNGTQIKTTGDVTLSNTHLPETGKERTVIIVLFVLLVLCLVVIVIDTARSARHDEKLRLAEERATKAETDLKTQVWLRQDKEEEKFQKFVAGPYAELAGKVQASQILFSKCKESKR